ncbi:P-loop containing nucleoside triphosphate hydrolase protein [Amniculicola lignicola CBS 123094]|uniref:P-loop containing nucleoside triphosphate hydrolase protein n=1 Tax=Amniculicola lignicola CBS 123094 TaxID=1392246 RepID=A0A6A5WBW5_9PLEO|nr:P-loop containing nucleoside triphosphate hydrolase protein [Amniculicola lignicola CBS 123094]
MHSLNNCTIESQMRFGPANRQCHGGFDFTLYFEETFLSIVPFTIIIPFLIFRLYRLKRAPIVVGGARWHLAKQVYVPRLIFRKSVKITNNPTQAIYVLYGAINVFSMGAIVMPDTVKTSATVGMIIINILATFILAIVSNFEHYRNSRPSSPIIIYLIVTWFFDIARIRTLWATQNARPLGSMLVLATLTKFSLLVLEAKEKRNSLLDQERYRAPEYTANFFNRLVFFWVNPLLLKGYSKPLQEYDLFEVQNQIIGEKEMLALVDKWDKSVGNGLIAAYIIVYTGYAITGALHQHRNYRSISKLRGTLIGIIYKKTLTMSSSTLTESEAVTLMNADVERITVGLRQSQELWASFYEIALSVALLHQQISWAALTPLGVIFGCTAAAIGISPKLAASQKTWLDKIQGRVDATAAMLGSIKAVKMTGLTPDLGKRIHGLRETEIDTARTFRGVLVKITTFSFASTSLSPVVALGTYILMAKYQDYPDLTLERALTSLVLMNLLLEPVAFFITALSGLINTMSCMERIRKYLNTEVRMEPSLYRPRTPFRSSTAMHRPHNSSQLTLATLTDVATISDEPLLTASKNISEVNEHLNPFDDIYFDDGITLASTNEKRDCIVAEDASCGWDKEKAPILSNLNFNIKEGSLTMIVGPVSSGKSTLLKAILGETTTCKGLQRSFYTEVAYCSQTAWLVNGTLRDNITHGADFDREWYNTVVQACDLETDIASMALGDETIVGSKGLSLSGGQQQRVSLARAVYFRRSVVMIDDVMCGLDATTEEHIFDTVLGEHGLLRHTDTTVIFVTNAVNRLSQADHIIALGEDGTVIEQGSFAELYRLDGYVGNLSFNEHSTNNLPQNEPKSTIKMFKQSLVASKEAKDISKDNGAGDLTIYAYYIRTFGWLRWCVFCFFCALYGFGTAFPNVWVKWWATHNQEHPNEKITYYLGLYLFFAMLGLGSLVVACWYVILIMTMTPDAGRKLHACLLQAVLNAPMPFFSSTDTGITTNRFSQDLELIDMELPVALIRTAMMLFVLSAQLLVILASAKYVGIALPFTIVVIYFLQMFYLRTSRRLRLLDIETKAYLGTQFIELLSGIVTVRAFQWEYLHLSNFLGMLKKAQRPFYLLYCIQRWLNMVLDLIVGSIAVLLVIIAVKTKGSVDPGMTGLALVNLVGFSQMLKQLITNWTLLETSMGALARIRSFTSEVESENLPGEDHMVPDQWPKFGGIEFRNVVASHNKAKKPTLNDISFAIPPGTKLGLCGRSGSGKSSLIATLLRLMDIESGSIIIDGIDVSTLPRQTVRSRLIALPQDPYVLAGTVRENVDPIGKVSDREITSALRKVKLDHLVDNEDIGLNAKLNPDMLSQGQRQLLCLARAMVRKGSILILDEATASVDVHTDALMQHIIRSEFKHHTIIAAAHRLDTIIDFDAVLMLDAGRIVESDNPQNLLCKDSGFKELYQIQKGDVQPWANETLSLINDASDRVSLLSHETGW